ncbi:AGE family epimerase/isomerase [Salinactinospora qingdaonensis]|uniref:AGE family epimerase/isomerase n=1 Tax=Salinactinospora qingdaonensis TaxID=702744 RepID=A0ABP7FF73_9ACTN
MSGSWLDLPDHHAWLAAEEARLTGFAAASALNGGGFAWLNSSGRPDPGRPVMTWITARMTHVYAMAHLRGEPGAGTLADCGLAALRGPLRDSVHGGWFPGMTVQESSPEPIDTTKAAYEHAFVLIAASSATAAERPGAVDLLADALGVVEDRFWDDTAGMCRESWDRSWSQSEPYRGANSNMHMIEAFLAAGDATGDPVWHRRALRIAERIVHQVAAGHDWRLVEHFTPDWEPDLDYNIDDKHHQFRPYGTTVGHWLEWSRLLLHLDATLAAGPEGALGTVPEWLLTDAVALFDAAVERGWGVDGADGFVYTLDWQDQPVVRERMHWVIAEAILAAAALCKRTGESRFEHWYRAWWDYAAHYHIDRVEGSWHHELDSANRPSQTVWPGKPDIYHAYQATVLPRLPLAPSPGAALRRILEDERA